MPRSKGKFQKYAKVIVWFRNGVKTYKLDSPAKLKAFVSKAKRDKNVIKFVVENITKYVY